jgi:hypothetical protein
MPQSLSNVLVGTVSFTDEYRELMQSAGIEIDERYVWD